MTEPEIIEAAIEAASDMVDALPTGQRAWDEREAKIAGTAAREAVRLSKPDPNDERQVEAVARVIWEATNDPRLRMRSMSWEALLDALDGNPDSWRADHERTLRQARAVLTMQKEAARG